MIKVAVIILLLLVFTLLVFFEWKKGGKRLVLRVLAIFLAILSLYLLLFPPGINVKKQVE
jgi:cytochrome bd-type quinol oxidase subunit 2